jgi:hypothetical protein
MNDSHGRMCISTPSIWTNYSQTFHFRWNFHNDLTTQIFLYRMCGSNIIFAAAGLSIQNWNIKNPPLTRSLFSQWDGKAVLRSMLPFTDILYESYIFYSFHMRYITILVFLSSIFVGVEKFYLKFFRKTSKHTVQSSYGLRFVPFKSNPQIFGLLARATNVEPNALQKIIKIIADPRNDVCCYGRFRGTALNILPSCDEVPLQK